MQMLEALEDMLEQQRKAISAQKVAISALKDPDFPVSQFPQWKINHGEIMGNLIGNIFLKQIKVLVEIS